MLTWLSVAKSGSVRTVHCPSAEMALQSHSCIKIIQQLGLTKPHFTN